MNSQSLVDADHHKAVEVLKEAGNYVTMVVSREVLRSKSTLLEKTTPPNSLDTEVEMKVEVSMT